MSNDPTVEQIRTICRYDTETGLFVRIMKQTWKGNWRECYSVPKAKTSYGYLQININGWPYLVHRLIFLYMMGEFPKEDVDHIDGDRLNNKWSNLRLVNRQDNLRNQGIRTDNTSGVIGVSYDTTRRKYHAYIGVGGGARKSLGYFERVEDAIEARKNAEIGHDYHKNHGTREGWRGE